jgi:hypothetical protein
MDQLINGDGGMDVATVSNFDVVVHAEFSSRWLDGK